MDKQAENTGRMAGDERREQVLRVAMKLFSENGFSGTTTREIAGAAGISEATVFKHFANKEELYTAILDYKACSQGLDNPFDDIAEKFEQKDDFGIFYHIALEALTHHEDDCTFLRLMLHSALEEHNLARLFFENYITLIYEKLGDYIKTRQADGAFRDVDPKLVVRAFVGMFVFDRVFCVHNLWHLRLIPAGLCLLIH